jgi:hypothetical protein
VNTPDAARLQQISDDVTHGRSQSKVSAVVRFEELPTAIERNRTQPQVGKTVADFFL